MSTRLTGNKLSGSPAAAVEAEEIRDSPWAAAGVEDKAVRALPAGAEGLNAGNLWPVS
jgi:hypothetical protein